LRKIGNMERASDVFIDCKKVFDSVKREDIWKSLEKNEELQQTLWEK
jgi:hypothetical protein